MKRGIRISCYVVLSVFLLAAAMFMLLRNQYSASTLISGAEICDNGIDDNVDGIVDGCWDPDKANYQPTGRIYYVDSRGSDSAAGTQNEPYLTINKATSQVKPGEAVYVMPGIYHDYVEFGFAGTPTQPIILKGVGAKGSIIIQKPADELSTGFRGVTPKSNTIIDNIKTDGVETVMDRGHSQGGYGIDLRAVQNILIKNSIMQQHDTAIRASSGSRLIVRDTLIQNCESGVYIGTDNDNGSAIEFGDTLWENVEAADAVPFGERLDGFLIEGNTSHHIFRNCKSHGWSDSGFDLKGHVIIENSVSYNNRNSESGYGFKIWRDGVIRNSIAYDNSEANYLFGGYQPNWKLINSLSYNGSVSFEKRAASSPALSNSTIMLSHNIFINTTINDEIGGAFTFADHNLFFGGDTPSPSGTLANTTRPSFLNETGRDFHLIENSAPIDAGSATLASYMLITDLDGNARKSGTAVDIGPYEYSSSGDSGGTVGEVNHDPIIAPIANVTSSEGVAFTVTATDPDNDPVTLSAQNLPAGAKFDAKTGEFSWLSSLSQRSIAGASYQLTFLATDSHAAVATTKVTVILQLFPSTDRKLQVATTTRQCSAPCNIEFMAMANIGGRITKYTWRFGDGASANGQSVSHTYTKPGNYNVTIDIYTRIKTHIYSNFYINVTP